MQKIITLQITKQIIDDNININFIFYFEFNGDLNNNISILTEGIQIILRREGVANSYELVKNMFRGKTTISYDDYLKFINDIDELSYESKKILLELTPEPNKRYGKKKAKKNAKRVLKKVRK